VQLGKLTLLKKKQKVSCKTGANRTKSLQRVTAKKQNAEFEPLYHSVYEGRERLGHYVRISAKRYAAYDASDRFIGKFASKRAAFVEVGRKGISARGGEQ
jgi:hypothetical protein